MNFNKHSDLLGKHAFMSASQYSWLNYDKDKLINTYMNAQAKIKGTILHDFAAQCITLGQKLPDTCQTLNMYVNDAIGYNMQPEQVLYYSDNCFGTADAISFDDKTLRIHDYKSGVTIAHMEQLEIYAALFCLEYGLKPKEMNIILQIYQNDEVIVHEPEPGDIAAIMKRIVKFDKIINKIKQEE